MPLVSKKKMMLKTALVLVLWMYLKWIKTLRTKMKTTKKQNVDIDRSKHHLLLLANLPIITSLHKHITTKARILIRDREIITLSRNKKLNARKVSMEIMHHNKGAYPGSNRQRETDLPMPTVEGTINLALHQDILLTQHMLW